MEDMRESQPGNFICVLVRHRTCHTYSNVTHTEECKTQLKKYKKNKRKRKVHTKEEWIE